jgi:hypothetical protein
MIGQMLAMAELFAQHVDDRSTLDELHRMIADEDLWHEAHDLFDSIRSKALAADAKRDAKRSAQYLFEEVCAKTLFNLTDTDMPFDKDAPYWVVPAALSLAQALGVNTAKVTRIVAS